MKKAKAPGPLSPMVTLVEGANIKLDPREHATPLGQPHAPLPGWSSCRHPCHHRGTTPWSAFDEWPRNRRTRSRMLANPRLACLGASAEASSHDDAVFRGNQGIAAYSTPLHDGEHPGERIDAERSRSRLLWFCPVMKAKDRT